MASLACSLVARFVGRRFSSVRWGALALLAPALVACRERSTQEDVAAKLPAAASSALRPAAAFAALGDDEARSRGLFLEASRVMLHPRCANCHPAGDSPLQGDARTPHDPPVQRGPDDHGVPSMECVSCHQDKNTPLARVPGAPNWALAPRSMAWTGKTPREVCEQLKDPARNGGKTLPQITEHAAHDPLVAWGWQPGSGRAPAPGDQASFGALVDAWAKSGAHCPKEPNRR